MVFARFIPIVCYLNDNLPWRWNIQVVRQCGAPSAEDGKVFVDIKVGQDVGQLGFLVSIV